MKFKKYKIAFVSEFDIRDMTQRSGVPHFIANGFMELGHEVIQIGPFLNNRRNIYRVWNGFLVTLFNKLLKGKFGYINNQWSKEFLKNYASQAKETLKGQEYDLVFSPESHTIAYLDVDKPIVFWRDATFENLLDYYKAYSNIHPISVKQGHYSEKQAIKRTSLVVYTSQWAAESGKDHYQATQKQIAVIERGTNLKLIPEKNVISSYLEQKIADPVLKILFIAGDWVRKGGDAVFEMAVYLNKNGVPTELHAMGGEPSKKLPQPEWFMHYGYVEKNTEKGALLLQHLYAKCHFFVMPSLAENFGIVYAEASALGIPSMAWDTGGVTSAIKEGKNGMLFPFATPAVVMAERLRACWINKDEYKALCEDSRKEYEARLNWRVNCQRLLEALSERLDG